MANLSIARFSARRSGVESVFLGELHAGRPAGAVAVAAAAAAARTSIWGGPRKRSGDTALAARPMKRRRAAAADRPDPVGPFTVRAVCG